MKNIMDIAREVKSLEYDEAHREIFELIKKDKTWLAEIVQLHVNEIIEDVLAIKNIVHDYHNPMELIDLEEEIEEKNDTPS